MKVFILAYTSILILGSVFSLPADTLLSKALGDYTEQEGLAFIQELKTTGKQVDLYVGIVYHNLAVDCPEKYVDLAITHLKAAYEIGKNNLALAYWGSALTIRAGMAAARKDLVSAAADLEQGVQKIDAALTNDAANIALRFLRIINSIKLKKNSPLNRLPLAKEDMRYLEAKYSVFNNSSKSLYKLCEGKIALAENRIQDALSCLEQAIQLNPQSAAAREAQAILAELEE
jgi:tetratricopeptide (TPR) repeat protein